MSAAIMSEHKRPLEREHICRCGEMATTLITLRLWPGNGLKCMCGDCDGEAEYIEVAQCDECALTWPQYRASILGGGR